MLRPGRMGQIKKHILPELQISPREISSQLTREVFLEEGKASSLKQCFLFIVYICPELPRAEVTSVSQDCPQHTPL